MCTYWRMCICVSVCECLYVYLHMCLFISIFFRYLFLTVFSCCDICVDFATAFIILFYWRVKVSRIFKDFLTPWTLQKQPLRGVPWKRCSENMQQIYSRTPTPRRDFNEVALQLYWNHTSVCVFCCKFAAYFQNTFS